MFAAQRDQAHDRARVDQRRQRRRRRAPLTSPRTRSGPFDAAIVLGDLAGAHDALALRRALLRRLRLSAVAAAAHARRRDHAARPASTPGAPSVLGQLRPPGVPAAAGRAGAARRRRRFPRCSCRSRANAARRRATPVSAQRLEAFGRGVLSAVYALDAAPDISAAMQTGVLVQRQTIPEWALRLLVGTLLLGPLAIAVDGLARAAPPARAGRRAGAVGAGLRAAVPARRAVRAPARPARSTAAAPLPRRRCRVRCPFDGAGRRARVAATVLVLALAWLLWPRGDCAGWGLTVAPGLRCRRRSRCARAGRLSVVVWALNPYTALLLVPGAAPVALIASPRAAPAPAGRARPGRARARAARAAARLLRRTSSGSARATLRGRPCCCSPAGTSAYPLQRCGASPLDAPWPRLCLPSHRPCQRPSPGWAIERGSRFAVRGPTRGRDRSAAPSRPCDGSCERCRTGVSHRDRPSEHAGRLARGSRRAGPRGALARALALALIVIGALALVDAGVTLVWQEPFSAPVRQTAAGSSQRARCARSNAPPPTPVERHALASAARRAPADRLPRARARTPRRRRGRGGADRDPADRGELRGGQGHRHRRPEERAGHLPETRFPGVAGTTAIAGHRTTYLAPFRHIDSLRARQPNPAAHALRALHLHGHRPAGGLAQRRQCRDRATSAIRGSCCRRARRCSAPPNACSCSRC